MKTNIVKNINGYTTLTNLFSRYSFKSMFLFKNNAPVIIINTGIANLHILPIFDNLKFNTSAPPVYINE